MGVPHTRSGGTHEHAPFRSCKREEPGAHPLHCGAGDYRASDLRLRPGTGEDDMSNDDDRADPASELERDAQSADRALGRMTHLRHLRDTGGRLR